MLVSDYLEPVFNIEQYAQIMQIVEEFLRKEKFDSIAFRGASGSAVAFPLALHMKKEMLHVRKSGGHSHASIEGQTNIKSYVVIDDFVETGDTLNIIKDNISKWYMKALHNEPVCKAVFLYNESCSGIVLPKIDKIFPKATIYALEEDRKIYRLYIHPANNRCDYKKYCITFTDGEMQCMMER